MYQSRSYGWEVRLDEVKTEELRSTFEQVAAPSTSPDELVVLKLCVEQIGYQNYIRSRPIYAMKKEGKFEISYAQLASPEPILTTIFSAMDMPLTDCRNAIEVIVFHVEYLIAERARRGPTPAPRPTLPLLDVKVWVKSSLWFDDLCARLFRQRRYSDNPMVPAGRSAVGGLEKVILADCCAICLEDFSSGATVTRSPCCHVFHHHCLLRWLDTSRRCPICRFQIPAV